MRNALLFSVCLLVTVMVAGAADPNVALNKPVTLNGSFPVLTYPGALCGVNPPQPAASTVVNGIFFPEQTCFQSGVYWSADPANAPNPNNTIDIDLGGSFLISAATVQADDNDTYTLQYRDTSGVYHDWWNIGAPGPFGLITRPNSADVTQRQALAPVVATGLRFFAPAGSGDLYYSVSEIAVFGVAVIPPTISKAFAPAGIFPGGTSTLTITLTNPNPGTALSGLAFTDIFPAGLTFANPSGLTSTCGGVTVAVFGTSTLSLSGGSLAAGASCTVGANVVGVSPGTKVNTTSTLTSNEAAPGTPATATIVVYFVSDTGFQVRYGANPAAGESYINIVNTGANGAPLLGPGFGGASGNICVNVYAFSPDEQLISCCSCFITPNGVANLAVNRDLTIKTLTGVVPTSVVLKLVSTLAGPGGTGGDSACNNSAAMVTSAVIVPGMLAWGTTLHSQGAGFAATETPFVPAQLSAQELASIGGRCASILGNGSGYGKCLSCRAGALGAASR